MPDYLDSATGWDDPRRERPMTVTTTYQVAPEDAQRLIILDTTAGDFAATMPPSSGVPGAVFRFIKIGGNVATLTAVGTELIGETDGTLAVIYDEDAPQLEARGDGLGYYVT